jgi:hypothetical protein
LKYADGADRADVQAVIVESLVSTNRGWIVTSEGKGGPGHHPYRRRWVQDAGNIYQRDGRRACYVVPEARHSGGAGIPGPRRAEDAIVVDVEILGQRWRCRQDRCEDR